MTKHQVNAFISFCDNAMFFGVCALIFFLPISIALVESFTGFAFFFFILKRIGLYYSTKNFTKSFSLVETALNNSLLFWSLWVILSIVFSQYRMLGVIGFFGKVFEGIVIYFVVVESINSKKRLVVFLWVMLAAGVLTVSSGVYQWFTTVDFVRHNIIPDGRLTSSLRAPNDFAVYLNVYIPLLISLAFFLKQDDKFKHQNVLLKLTSNNSIKIFLFLLLPLFLFCLGMTFSRGGLLALIVVFGVVTFRDKRLMIGAMFCVFTFIVYYIFQMVHYRAQMRWGTLFNAFGREGYWLEAWHIIRDHPIFGVGLNAYSQVGKLYKINWGGYPHNCYLQMAAEIGIPGLLLFLWLLFNLYKEVWQRLKSLQDNVLKIILLGVIAGLSGFLFQSFFDTFFYSSQLGSLLWILIGLSIAIGQLETRKEKPLRIFDKA